jgi:hypothetical protein
MIAIRIEVEPEVAKAFQAANKIDRQKLHLLVNGWLKQSLQRRSLDEIIDHMQAEAKANGFTQTILDEILSDE